MAGTFVLGTDTSLYSNLGLKRTPDVAAPPIMSDTSVFDAMAHPPASGLAAEQVDIDAAHEVGI
ncbi:hypothetical protein [Mycolicibacter kumamotonensis]|uniref:Uncharacterized protein n=1 Tax=Mycolicibacter kumamotonensis TaxID=354243 RepID=A0A1B8SLC5_9MYCO|nr:hypothetical protein [Mycolicibacter kumamotonensis]OBY33528.1 hypothetical protein ACT18_00930 [Mycolicibacter kumamotonensis]